MTILSLSFFLSMLFFCFVVLGLSPKRHFHFFFFFPTLVGVPPFSISSSLFFV